jgi:SAM-dependent methyltransferase
MTWPQQWPNLTSLCNAVGSTPGQTVFVAENRLPFEDAHLPLFARALAGSIKELQSATTLVWIQPLGPHLSLTIEEAEQILGAAGAVKLLERDQLSDGRPCYVAVAIPRPKMVGFCLRWRLHDIEDRQDAILRTLDRFDSDRYLHMLELPPEEQFVPSWQRSVGALIRELSVRSAGNCVVGAFLPELPLSYDCYSRSIRCLNDMAGKARLRRVVECMWAGSIKSLGDTRLVHAFARENGIGFDFSLSYSPDEAVRPYLLDGAYFPLSIDPRAPAGVASGTGVVELPRMDRYRDKTLPLSAVIVRWREFKRMREVLEGQERRVLARLKVSLDRQERAAYLKQLEGDSSRVSEWNVYHVYNWAPPPDKLLRIVAVDASALLLSHQLFPWIGRISTKLIRTRLARSHIVLCSGAELMKAAREQAEHRVTDRAGYLRLQITGHAYLADGRKEITADGRALIEEFPEHLGATLDVGCGYGLTAGLVAERATRYVGLDIWAAPVATSARKGMDGVVADIHGLPFSCGTFDTAIADNVIEHSYEPVTALKEIHRVLKPGGRLFALLPLDGNTCEYRIKMHMWKADIDSVREAFQEAGYAIERLRVLRYAELGVYGCFPASCGETCLIVATKRDNACAE